MAKIFLSLGSNKGDRRRFLSLAILSIENFCKITKVSPVYETRPWGKQDQPDFLNLCLEAETSLAPKPLLHKLKEVESKLGRTKTTRWAEREIDIDILFYDYIVLDKDGLKLPHPLIGQRAFVLIPLADIAPELMHPLLGETVAELVKKIGSSGVRKLVRIMGILNITPDSFSDGGKLSNDKLIKQKAMEMIDAGVDIIDIGGESTRPGHQKISAAEEISRITPAIKAVRKISAYMKISVDTQKAEVAEKALETGANIINDVSALSDPKMAVVVKKFDCPIILMRSRPLDPQDITGSCARQFEEILKKCEGEGISKNNVILDPGLGFGDLNAGDFSAFPGGSPAANSQLVLNIKDYGMGLPVLIGASRKRFLGRMSGQEDAKKRLNESLAFAVLAKYSGASILRAHDVKETTKILFPQF